MFKKDFKKALFRPKLSLITLCLIQIYSAHASESSNNPRITGQFLSGDNKQLGGFLDGMMPLIQSANNLFFADSTILSGQNQRMTYSGGLGYRQIKNTSLGSAILGFFGFVDFYRTNMNHNYTQINPGIEWLTLNYEARLQAYVPASSRSIAYRDTLASAIPDNILFDSGRSIQRLAYANNHQIIDTPVQLIQEFGPGVELELGKHFNNDLDMWVHVGGYHFSYKNSNDINGVQANVEFAIKKNMALIFQDNYDNQNKNRFAVGLRVNFGGSTAPEETLAHRMTAPIIRHAARQSYGEALPVRQSFRVNGNPYIFADNVWFFSPNGSFPAGLATTFANCTAQNPCSTIDTATAAQIASLAPNAKFYFESGNYFIPQNGSRWVNLQNGQSVWGRNPGWLTPADASARPLIEGGLIWGNQAANMIANGEARDIRILNNNQITPQNVFNYGPQGTVFGLAATGNLNVENSSIEVDATTDNISALGIAANTATINNVNINTASHGAGNINNPDNKTGANALGVYTLNQLTSLENSIVFAETTGDVNNNGKAIAMGAISELSTVNIYNSSLTAITRGNVTAGTATAYAVNNAVGQALIRDSVLYAETFGNVNGTLTDNGFASAWGVDSNQADVKNSIVTVRTHGDVTFGQAIVFGVEGGTVVQGGINIPGTALVENSTVDVSSTGNAGLNGSTFVQGVRASTDLIVNNSQVRAVTSGSAIDGGVANPSAIRSFQTASVTNSTIYSESFGNAVNLGNVNSFGILASNAVTSINNTITAQTHGDADNSTAQALGIQATAAGNTILIENSVINTLTEGTALNGGSVASYGVLASTGTGTIQFQGGDESRVTAISINDAAIAVLANGGITNGSTPPSQCSTDGVNYVDC
ncbi:hypothetical protein ACFORL_01230 [Legionella dresdenensis]|uniref:Inverse autotransporter beta-domain domain-containing protein n=1 Tax=Legionella dresdenensis TaxID=450200 RepID=A0ABV8CCN2_9GAMM